MIKLKLNYEDKRKAEFEVLTIGFDAFGMKFQEVDKPYGQLVKYEELKSWEAKGTITDKQKESGEKLKKLSDK